MSATCQVATPFPALLSLYSDWHFCNACGLPPSDSTEEAAATTKRKKKKLFACKRCKTVAYHNAECQKIHWKQRHKKDCKLLAQAIQPLLDISRCWNDFHSNDKSISWWDLESLDPKGARDSHNLWHTSEIRWNQRGEYLEAMAGFQRALEPVSKLWKKQVETASQPDRDSTSPLGLSNLSLNEQNDSDDKAPEPNISKIHAGIALAQKLLFCSYCEADGNQIQASRMRLAQCISILLECAYYKSNHIRSLDQHTKQGVTSAINTLLNDAWMELMLSYEEEEQGSVELRTISRHVVHMAIQSSCNNVLYNCEWRHPLQRPGYTAALEYATNSTPIDQVHSKQIYSAPPYIPPEDHPSWCKTLESHWKDIAAELSSLVQKDSSSRSNFNPHWTVVGSGDRGSGGDDHRVVSPGGKWTEYVLFGTGASRATADAPFTKNLLRQCVPDAVSLAQAGGGEVIFSKLEPNTRIAAHCGPTNFRWTAHLGLVIPDSSKSCSIRVADQWHQWETGKVLLFDDSYEHEISNDTSEIRIVLLLRLWHPWLSSHKRQTELDRALCRKEEAVEKRYKAPPVQ